MLSKFYYSANEFSKSEEKDWQVSKRSNALLTAYHPGTSVLKSILIRAQPSGNLSHFGSKPVENYKSVLCDPFGWKVRFNMFLGFYSVLKLGTRIHSCDLSLFKIYRSRISRLYFMDCEFFYSSSIFILICFKIQFWNKLNEFILAN